MKKVFIVASAIVLTACYTNKQATAPQETATVILKNAAAPYANTITVEEMKTDLYIYASDEFEGRDTGAPGQKKAVEWLQKQYKKKDVFAVFMLFSYINFNNQHQIFKTNTPCAIVSLKRFKFPAAGHKFQIY